MVKRVQWLLTAYVTHLTENTISLSKTRMLIKNKIFGSVSTDDYFADNLIFKYFNLDLISYLLDLI